MLGLRLESTREMKTPCLEGQGRGQERTTERTFKREAANNADGGMSTDSDNDGTDCDDFNKKTQNSSIKHAKVPEENPLPGPFRKRTRRQNRSKRSRQCCDFTESNSDTVIVTTGHDLGFGVRVVVNYM